MADDTGAVGEADRPTIVVIGNFDGVHRGHRAVIAEAARRGRVVAVTFCPHPLRVVRPEAAPPRITDDSQRRDLLVAAGVAEVVEIAFTAEVSRWSPETFVEQVLVPLDPAVVVVGENFRFGHRAAGDPAELARLGEGRFVVETLDLQADEASSTRIRRAVAAGDIRTANQLLGREVRFSGVVVQGHQRGRELGFPTANLPVEADRVVPADGIYAGWVTRLDQPDAVRWPAAISVGTNPTFDDVLATVVEAHVLDRFDLELYGVPIAVDFVDRLRGNVRYEGLEALIAQMAVDVQQTKTVLAAEAEAVRPG